MATTCRLCRLPEHLRDTLGLALSLLPTLTSREHQILEQLVTSPEYGELARSLGISERTVKFHVTNLRNKLGGLSRLHLCMVALLDLMALPRSTDICPSHRTLGALTELIPSQRPPARTPAPTAPAHPAYPAQENRTGSMGAPPAH
ncbi:helix-turn-helix domain-containing protein [Streptomyces sp. NPDC002513]